MIRHILLVKFNVASDSDKLAQVKKAFLDIPNKISGVTDCEFGENDSDEGRNKGYTHCIFMTFANEAGRQEYMPHPEHTKLKQIFVPLIEDLIVIDYSV